MPMCGMAGFHLECRRPCDELWRMRRILLAVTFVALVAALVLLWAHRYQRADGLPRWQLADLRQDAPELAGLSWGGTLESPVLRLKRSAGEPPLALRLAIPDAPEVEALHLRLRLSAQGLRPGAEKWETGRFMIEWHPPDGQGSFEKDPVASIKDDEDSGPMTLVAVPANGPAVPAIRLEHLGIDGTFELTELEITAAEERGVWKYSRWLLALCWLAWCAACIHSWPGVKRGQALAAAGVCLLMAVEFVIPGPWKIQRPLLAEDFRLGAAIIEPPPQTPRLAEAPAPLRISSGEIAPSGNILAQGGLALRVRTVLKPLRPLLHVALLAAPTFAFALLLGRRRAVMLAVPLALAVECAQSAFGYGFDWGDAADLAFDGIGIWLALWLHRHFDPQLRPLISGAPAWARSWIDR